jgi:acetyltransferase-like isoleucine patch superfamily enzyme
LGTIFQAVAVWPFLLLAAFTAGVALSPAVYCFQTLYEMIPAQGSWHWLGLAFSLVFSYGVYGFALILIAPLFNLLLGGRLVPRKDKQVSLRNLTWYVHATMTLLPRLSFLEFICATPYLNLFYVLMGMKIGKNVAINTTAIADPSLIEIGDNTTLGGSCSIMGHYAQKGYLVLARVKIGAGVTIGLRAIVMGGVTIGDRAKVLAGSFVLPKTVIPAGETWGGIPARPVTRQELALAIGHQADPEEA